MTGSVELTHIAQVALHAADLDRSAAFYRDVLGATLIAQFDPPGLLFFEFSGVRLLLEKGAGKGLVYFRTENIESTVAALQAKGVDILEGPSPVFPDQTGLFGPAGETEWMAFFKDPGGNTLALIERKPAA